MTEELNRVVNETRIGRDLGESLDEVARRTDNEDFGWIARAVEIHREVGGDLAEVLDHVGETIRDRNQIRGQVRALSAEGRISALGADRPASGDVHRPDAVQPAVLEGLHRARCPATL